MWNYDIAELPKGLAAAGPEQYLCCQVQGRFYHVQFSAPWAYIQLWSTLHTTPAEF